MSVSSRSSDRSTTLLVRQWLKKNRGHLLVLLILIPVAILWALPFLLMISTSLKTQTQLYSPTKMIPNPIAWGNYQQALFGFLPFLTFFKNSFIVSFFTVVGDVLSSAFIAYGFARLRFRGRNTLFIVMLSTMMLPFAVRMIPLLITYRALGWINTFLPLIVPSYLGKNALFIFLVTEFYKNVPESLSEVARIDGANELQIWWHVMLPLSKPVLTVVGILAFQQSWNDFLPPLVFLNDVNKYTVPLGLFALIGGNDAPQPWQYLMAATTTTIIPIVLIFFFGQRYFVRGITISGGMKG